MDRQDWVDQAIALSLELLALADHEGADDEDDEHLLLQGILRDSAFKIRKAAQGLLEDPHTH